MINVDEKMNITLTKGDSATLELTLMNGEEEYDYSNDDVKFVVKRSQQDSDVVLEKTVEDSKIDLTPADSNGIEGFGDFLYAIKVYHTEEDTVDVYTPIVARFTLGFNVVA